VPTTHTVLVVEDNNDSQDMIARIFRYHQISYEVVGSAEDAMVRLAGQPYAALVIDLSLPVMDGWTLMHNLRNQAATAHLACVAITSYHSAELAAKAIEAGFTAYYPKPINTSAFVAEIQRLLAKVG
jgi:CheY-like chemotaxis protein